MEKYVSGACNIGPKNRIARALFGTLVIMVVLYASAHLKTLSLPRLVQFVLVIPLYIGFLGVWQGVLGFCVMHAHKSTFDLR